MNSEHNAYQPTKRQQDIVNAAINIIARAGYQELTTKRLAAALNLSEAALYRHFESKSALIYAILDYFQQVAADTFGHIHQTISNPLEQVKAFVVNRYSLFIQQPELAKLMFSEELFLNDTSLAEHVLGIMHIHRDQLLLSLRLGQEQGIIRRDLSPLTLFRLVIGPLRLLVTQWNLSGQEFDLLEEGTQLWNAIEKIIKEPT